MKKQNLILTAVVLLFAIIFGWYLFVTNPRNTKADIYLDNCLKSGLAIENIDIKDVFTSCEMVVGLYRKYGEWKF
ncbi:MAG: hypothetical protein ABID64_04380 [Nitrospirota bacterium]